MNCIQFLYTFINLMCIYNLIQTSQAVKKTEEGHCEKRYEIQAGSQETAVMVG